MCLFGAPGVPRGQQPLSRPHRRSNSPHTLSCAAGFPCGPLYDPRNATAGIYGYYLSSRTAICGGFAKEKSKGYY